MIDNKQKIVEVIKQEILSFTNELNELNISETVKSINSQIEILTSIENASFFERQGPKLQITSTGTGKEPVSPPPGKHQSLDPDSMAKSSLKSSKECDDMETIIQVVEKSIPNSIEEELTDYISADKKIVRGKFTQKLKGGIVGVSTYVPESIVRELNIWDSDWIQARAQGSAKPYRYHFEVLKKASENVETRKLVEKTRVYKRSDVSRLLIRVDDKSFELPNEVILSQQDISAFQLIEGSIIDFAYHKGDLNNGRVVWKHNDLPKMTGFTIKQRQSR